MLQCRRRLISLDALFDIEQLLVRVVDDSFDRFEAVHRFFVICILIVHLLLQPGIFMLELKFINNRIKNIDNHHVNKKKPNRGNKIMDVHLIIIREYIKLVDADDRDKY
ncbi:hypothetical protein D3C74_400850 [compost metagenome]